MARKISRAKARIIPREKISKIKIQNGIFSKIKLTESYTSLVLGAIVVLIAGILLIFLAKGNRNEQTSSVKTPDINAQLQESDTSSTYTVNPGDDLWSISENVYNDGYKWIEIAKINNLKNPDLIHAGNKLIIQTATSVINQGKSDETKPEISAVSNNVTQNNSITEDTYKIKQGDNLWEIAVRAYGDGFKWPEIAKANSLTNPDLIFSDNTLKIPR